MPSMKRSGPTMRNPLRQPRTTTGRADDAQESDAASVNDNMTFRQRAADDDEDGLVLDDVRVRQSAISGISKVSSARAPSSQAVPENLAPAHDKEGRPMFAHGPETFGDIMMNPIRQLELHRRRVSIFEHEKSQWDEKHHQQPTTQDGTLAPVGADTEAAIPPPTVIPVVKTVIHFKHLMGEQAIRVTKDIVDQIRQPLLLTDDEILRLYTIKDTDDLVEFFHRSKRDYALKIHKTMHMGNRREEFKERLEDKLQAIEEKIDHHESETSSSSPRPSIEKERKPSMDESVPENAIVLNSNVYLELTTPEPPKEHEKLNEPRPIFALPDPDLSDEIGQETSATWVELFSDVFYVGWLSSFTHTHHMVSSSDLAEYAGWFVIMWWTWCSSALYSARYDNSDVMHHIYKIVDLCGLVGMAGASGESGNFLQSKGFIIGYMVMKAVLLVQYSVVLWAAVLSGSFAKKPLSLYVAVNALAIILWGVSLLFDAPDQVVQRQVLWYVSIGIEVLTNMGLQRFKQVSLAASHLAERFGLFTIIILGENCIGFIRMVTESGPNILVIVANMFGVIIIFSYFFMYFDDFCKEILSEVHISQVWMYLHFPLHLCQVAFGIALTDVITAYRLEWDSHGSESSLLAFEVCESLEHLAAGGGSANGTLPATEPTTHAALTIAQSLMKAVTEAATLSNEDKSKLEICEEIIKKDSNSLNYAFRAFWVCGGLILCINALIKLVNTPVKARWSRLICASRFLNAIVFFCLAGTTFIENGVELTGIKMLAIMMCCLLLQSCVDLLD
ncbi:bacterial low temperature requirement A protein-domain-containing protein [Gongronella butleri]|nr:bacterial low temperature requirement A protein-domain-containing protein [Gongronella butleri]